MSVSECKCECECVCADVLCMCLCMLCMCVILSIARARLWSRVCMYVRRVREDVFKDYLDELEQKEKDVTTCFEMLGQEGREIDR